MAALLTVGLVASAIYFLAIRDRSFQTYGGAEVGMEVRVAINLLQSTGYMLVSPPSSQIKDAECVGTERYYLVQLADPSYLVTISPDKSCEVSEIRRELRSQP